jgi:hypothetical protein
LVRDLGLEGLNRFKRKILKLFHSNVLRFHWLDGVMDTTSLFVVRAGRSLDTGSPCLAKRGYSRNRPRQPPCWADNPASWSMALASGFCGILSPIGTCPTACPIGPEKGQATDLAIQLLQVLY